MCGICGIAPADQTCVVPESLIQRMRATLAHRGPDDEGQYIAPGVGLGSRRLSILDLSNRGHMPMSTADGRYWIVYNGEIYNYRDLRARFGSTWTLRSSTDTEVLLHLYVRYGPAMLEHLNGMFSIAIWDAAERTLFLARDRMGIKPLYYAYCRDALYFASEEKSLFAAGVPLGFDHSTWEELLCFRYVAGERTTFAGVRRLLPGYYLLWQEGHLTVQRWWNLSERARTLRESLPRDPQQWYRETFDDAVRLREISDVPIGVLLSGGLDSSSVAASLARRRGAGVASFTVRFDEPEYDEGPLARQVVARWRLAPYEITVTPQSLLGHLRTAAWFSDQPQAHCSDVHLFALAKHAKSRVTVLLSGEGADETLGGYVRYQPLRLAAYLSAAKGSLRTLGGWPSSTRWQKLNRFLQLGSVERFVLFNACDVLPEDVQRLGLTGLVQFTYREQIAEEARRLYPRHFARQAMYLDQHTFLCSVLDRNDRMTMAASIECRVPFLDYRLVEMLAALPSATLLSGLRGKALLRAAVGDRLPSCVRRHRKWGFGVPWNRYLRSVPELRVLLLELPQARLMEDSPLDRSAIGTLVRSFLAGDDGQFPLVMQLVLASLAWDAVAASDMSPAA